MTWRLFLLTTTCLLQMVPMFCFQSGIMPFWYPIIPIKELQKKNLHQVHFMGSPLVCYKKANESFVLHSDICPHQGASFGNKGWINEDGNLQCGYHGFEFCNGNFCKIPNPSVNPKRFRSRVSLTTFPTLKKKDFLFFNPTNLDFIPEIFYPPEENDPSFRGVDGYLIVNNNFMTVCENLLDMLHISYVHSFRSKTTPIPIDIQTKRLGEYSFQSQFNYFPNENTISGKIGKAPQVIVQNEYHLPTNTITRVFAGNIIKTVFTRSIPISANKTLLYWKIYRNFWMDPFLPLFNWIGDFLVGFLMERTIAEDVSMLENVFDDHREGPIVTKYDVTIMNFRKDVKRITMMEEKTTNTN